MMTYMQKVRTDNGSDQSKSVLVSRFTKKSSSSSVRILYYDNLRVKGAGKWCRWEVKVDGKSCPVPVAGSVYTYHGENDHYPTAILGECPGLAAGKHNINIALTRKSGADCYTGWTPSPFVMHALIEVQETSQSTQGTYRALSVTVDIAFIARCLMESCALISRASLPSLGSCKPGTVVEPVCVYTSILDRFLDTI